jgi:hypothetical protein
MRGPSGQMRAQTPLPMRAGSLSELSQELPKRSAAAVLGWLILGAVLFGGVGALVFVAMGERGTRSAKVEDVTSSKPVVGTGSQQALGSELAAPAATDGSNAIGSNPGSDVAIDPAVPMSDPALPPGVGSSDKTVVTPKPPNKRPNKPGPPKRAVIAAADEKDPKALIKQGKALEKAGEWSHARGVYQKLEKLKGYQGPALYMQAFAAYSANETGDAVRLAIRAASLPGTQKTDAKFLYGDALFRQREYKRAKDVFIGLFKMIDGDARATAQRKITACNRALKLPDGDGL